MWTCIEQLKLIVIKKERNIANHELLHLSSSHFSQNLNSYRLFLIKLSWGFQSDIANECLSRDVRLKVQKPTILPDMQEKKYFPFNLKFD